VIETLLEDAGLDLDEERAQEDPVRVLLATDAASEGISLQRQCHLLAHAEIPWNPNRLEQRNGRVDRHGQRADEVLVHHCVSAGWEDARRAPTARWTATWTSSRASCAKWPKSARTWAAPAR
jgi:superfamily II DNA/RNA helicase